MQAALLDESTDARTDEALVAAVNACDPEAFEVLYCRHRDWVANLAYRFTGDRQLALDVLQDTFLYFLKKFPGFRLTCQLRSFLYPAVRHLSITAQRKARRCQSDGTDLTDLEAAAPSEAAARPGDREDLAAALAGLSEEHRETLLLRFVDGLSLKEISDALEIPLGTVKSRLHHALAVLRRDERTKAWFSP